MWTNNFDSHVSKAVEQMRKVSDKMVEIAFSEELKSIYGEKEYCGVKVYNLKPPLLNDFINIEGLKIEMQGGYPNRLKTEERDFSYSFVYEITPVKITIYKRLSQCEK